MSAGPVSGGIVASALFIEQVSDLDDADNAPTDAIIDIVNADSGH